MRKWISILFLGCILSACHQKQSTQELPHTIDMENQSIPDREGWDAIIRISSEGKLQAIIKYGHMIYFEKSKTNYFDQGIQVDMFDKRGDHTTKLTSERGEYNESTQDIQAIENVIVVSDTGITLSTPILQWDQSLGKIISDTTVRVTTIEQDTIYGTSFQSNPDLSHMIIKNPKGTREHGLDIQSLEDEIVSPMDNNSGDD